MVEFQNKVAIVTGGASGIGRATALAFAHQGAKVVVADVQEEKGQETVGLIKKEDGEAIFVKTDVSKASAVEAMVKKTIETYGRLDYAYNNAGIVEAPTNTADCTEADWERTININLKGAWLCMKYEIPEILKQKKGAIVNCSSVAGLVGFLGIPAYVASKHGILGLTKTAALEYAKTGVRINAVCPGVIRTPMVEPGIANNPQMEDQLAAMQPLGRIGNPEEIAAAVLWLCSDGASFTTGHPMVVDGGLVAQ